MPITHSTGGRVSLGRTTIALSNIESQSESQGPNLYTTTFNFSFLENNPDYILIDRNGVQINSITTEPSSPGSFANYFIYVARTNGDDMESIDEATVVMPSHPIQRAITYTGGTYNSRTVRLQIPFTQAAANETYNNQIGIYAPEPATPTYSGSIAFNFNLDEWTQGFNSNHWSYNANVVESFYIMGTNVDTGLQYVLYDHLEEDVYTPTINVSEYPMDFGEAANSLIVHRYENKEEGEAAPQNLGNLLTITAKLKPGFHFNYNNDDSLGWSDPNNVVMNGKAVTKNPQWPANNPSLDVSSSIFTWKRIEATHNQVTWAVTLNEYPAVDGDWVYFVLDHIRGSVEMLSTANNYSTGLVISNSTNNQLYDVGPAGGYGQMLSGYSFDAQTELPLVSNSFNLPTEDYSDLYAAGYNYYDIGRLDMELESPIIVRYIITNDQGETDMIYESDPIFSSGFVQIGLEVLSQKLNESSLASGPYTITKVKVSIEDY